MGLLARHNILGRPLQQTFFRGVEVVMDTVKCRPLGVFGVPVGEKDHGRERRRRRRRRRGRRRRGRRRRRRRRRRKRRPEEEKEEEEV